MRRRINATRWPEKETVTEPNFSQRGVSPNWGQGVQLATIQKLARYWATDYDWRKIEARLKALPQFITNLLGRRAATSMSKMYQSRLPSVSSPTKSTILREAGQSGRIPNSSTTTRFPKGGHFAAWEQPQLYSEEIRAGLRSLRN